MKILLQKYVQNVPLSVANVFKAQVIVFNVLYRKIEKITPLIVLAIKDIMKIIIINVKNKKVKKKRRKFNIFG